jgi:OHCU decarboxylase
MPHSLYELDLWDQPTFVRIVGPAFEHSPWIAERTWPKRPFANVTALYQSLCDTVTASDEGEKLALIRAHPDLIGRAALAGTLTPDSAKEQAAAGLDRLTPEEISAFQHFNEAYGEKFGFPFVICARLNKKDAILASFRQRLIHSRSEEITAAIVEIFKIAELRLCDLFGPTPGTSVG